MPKPHIISRELLKNVAETASARQKQAKKQSLYKINAYFELVFNAAMATQVIFQRFPRQNLRTVSGCIFGLFLLLTLPLARAEVPSPAPILSLSTANDAPISLTEYFSILEDPSNQLDLAEVQKPPWANQFKGGQASAESLIYGFTRSAYWLQLQIQNPTANPIDQLLDISYARLAEVSLFQINADGKTQAWITGTNYSFATRPYANRGFVFPITIPAQTTQTFYLRVKGIAALEIPAKLWSPTAFHAFERDDYLSFSIYAGMVLAMLIFNGLIYALTREIMYLLYVCFVGCFALTLAAQNGLANEFFWPNSPVWTQYSLATGFSYTLVALLLFTRRMLNLHTLLPRIDKTTQLFAGVFLLSPLAFYINYQLVVPVFVILNVVASSLILGAGIYCALKRQRSAYFFVAAFLVICTASPVNSLRFAGFLPTNWFTVNGLQVGSAIEMLLLAYALADRFNMTQRDKVRAQTIALESQQHLLDALHESERRLEDDVKLRTQELIEKNAKLEQLAITDQLTGIYNRLKLNQVLNQEITRSRRYASPLSILLIDVDHFKAINDNYGHLMGDSVLTTIAQQLRNHSRANDAVGRWGGEEFLIICPETTTEGALALAQSLRTCIAEQSFDLGVKASISVGIAELGPEDSLESFIENADKHLYQAKDNGRNCVVA